MVRNPITFKLLMLIIGTSFLLLSIKTKCSSLAQTHYSDNANERELQVQNEYDDSLLTVHSKFFKILNKDANANNISEPGLQDYEDLVGEDSSSASKRSTIRGDPFPVLRSPKSKLRSSGSYEAEEVAHKSPEQIITLRGFGVETHHVPTKDGYHIHVVRIINPKLKVSKRPVLFNHGLFESSTFWLMKSRDIEPANYTQENCTATSTIIGLEPKISRQNLAFMLANTGYDVWLMSMRGTEFSLHHDKYNHKTEPKFWRFSLDHFALIDIPAVVDNIRSKTGAREIAYVGHSQATYSMFALLANKPKYQKIMKPVVALAPVSHFKHMSSTARILMKGILRFTGHEQHAPFPRNGHMWRDLHRNWCNNKLLLNLVCQFGNSMIGGTGQTWENGFYTHLPYQSSLMVLRHFGQMLTSGRFARYDYGKEKNLKFYKRETPPDHPIERIKSRTICLFGGDTDLLSTPRDFQIVEQNLNIKPMKSVMIKGLNHFDLITADRAGKEVFEPILDIIERIEHSKRKHCK